MVRTPTPLRREPARLRVLSAGLRTASAGILALLAWGCGPADEPGAPVELSFGHVGAPGSLFALSAEEFAARVNARLEGVAEVVVYGSSQLGGDDVMLQKLRLGTLDLALPSTILSSRIPEFGLFEMPFVVADREHMARIEDEVVWPVLAPLAADRGYRIIAVWENGFRHVTNNVRPIHSPADLAGIKLRTPRGTWRVRLFQAFGANPVPMALSETLLALRTGVVDGQENPLAQTRASRLDEVQRYLSLTEHVYTPAYVTVSPSHWPRLPQEVRAVIEEEARAMQQFVHETAARLDRELLVELDEADIEVNRADRAAFEAASDAVYDEFGAEVEGGAELIERVVRLMRQ